jgi:nicotinamide-nucleotide amidase
VATAEPRGIDTLTDLGPPSDEELVALASALHQAAIAAGVSVVTAESCTGGLVGHLITQIDGSSGYYLGGVVSYSDEVKRDALGVPPEMLERHGAVSAQVARAMADGARRSFGGDLAVSVTGVAGPGGGSEEKPVGTVCLSVANRDGQRLTRSVRLPGGRQDIRERSVTVSLHMLRRLLLGESDV